MENLLKSSELAKHLSLAPATIRRMTRAKKIPVIMAGKSKRYDLAAVLKALQLHTEEPRND